MSGSDLHFFLAFGTGLFSTRPPNHDRRRSAMVFKGFRVFDLAVRFFKMIRRLKAPAHLRTQLERAASSIALNAAEGYGRRSPADKRRFYQMALGSMRECQAI